MSHCTFATVASLVLLASSSTCLAAVSTDGDNKPKPTVIVIPAYDAASSSSSVDAAIPDAPGRYTPSPEARAAYLAGNADVLKTDRVKPFSAFGFDVKIGVAGIGFDVATPLSKRFNLRAGASFFNYTVSTVTSDNYNVNGTLNLKTVAAMVDFFPFAGSFRLTPGVTIYNGNHLNASAFIPGGSTFDLGDATYISSTSAPVNGSLDLAFGNKVAPSITAGFGNILPRGAGKHFSVPFEFGVEFIGSPQFTLNLGGQACLQAVAGATPCPVGVPIATDPTAQSNLKQEQADLNSNVSGLKAYPILSIGVGYKF